MGTNLTKFARNRNKEEVTVITARLVNSKYNKFKTYCDHLGLSINEAVNLLIDIELAEWDKENSQSIQESIVEEKENDSKDEKQKILDNQINMIQKYSKEKTQEIDELINKQIKNNNDDEKENDSKINHSTIQDEIIISAENELSDEKQNESAETTKNDSDENKNKFTVIQYTIDKKIPCPICNKWLSGSNFSKHADKQHNSTTEAIYNEHIEKVKEMYKDRAELQPKEQ